MEYLTKELIHYIITFEIFNHGTICVEHPVPGDHEKSEPGKFIIEGKVNGPLKCFKRCSVPTKLA